MKEIARFYDAEEAQIAAGFLRSFGFDVQLADEQALSVMPEMRMGLGGYRLLAADRDAHMARIELSKVRRAPSGPRCRNCGARDMRRERNPAYVIVHALFATIFPFAPPTSRLRCRSCGHTQRVDRDPSASEEEEDPA